MTSLAPGTCLLTSRFILKTCLAMSGSASNMRKRCDLSVSEKVKLLEKYDSLPASQKRTQRLAAEALGISQGALCQFLKNRDKLVESELSGEISVGRKRQRECEHPEIADALLMWFKEKRSCHAPLSRGILAEKSQQLAEQLGFPDFKCTDGWLSRWQARNGIVHKKLHGEKVDADVSGADDWIATVLPKILRKYAFDDVYNTDETGLYFRALPDHTLALRGDTNAGGKRQKERLTVLLTCNATGSDKKPPLVIGKSKSPRCFKGVKRLPVQYDANANAWMTSVIFEGFLKRWNCQLASENRRVALLLDNCTAHPRVELSHIELVFLPANTTSCIQPLDQGIIKAMKTLYRKEMRRKIIMELDDSSQVQDAFRLAKKINVLDGLHMIAASWKDVKSETIANCFRKARICNVNEDLIEPDVLDDPDFEYYEQWVAIDENLETSAPLTDADIVTAAKRSKPSTEPHEVSDDSDDEAAEPPSRKQFHDALSVVRRFLDGSRNSTEDHYHQLKKLEDLDFEAYKAELHQTTLMDFFS